MNMRPFVATDWIGAVILCPHCGQMLKVVKAAGPYIGRDPNEAYRQDRWWRLTFTDGADVRMWEDRKGVVTDAPASAGLN